MKASKTYSSAHPKTTRSPNLKNREVQNAMKNPASRKYQEVPPHFLFQHPAHFIALGAGTGLLPTMPGTWGSLLAIPIALLLHHLGSTIIYLGISIILLIIGTWAAHVTGQHLKEPDHPSIVIDEIAALTLLLFFTGRPWPAAILSFVLFRVFDTLKPPPIDRIDKQTKTALGVMLDDLIAAIYTLILITLLLHFGA